MFPYVHQLMHFVTLLNNTFFSEMWTEDLLWAWKLRDQKRKQDENKNGRNLPEQESKELLELYASDLEQEKEMERTSMNLITKEK